MDYKQCLTAVYEILEDLQEIFEGWPTHKRNSEAFGKVARILDIGDSLKEIINIESRVTLQVTMGGGNAPLVYSKIQELGIPGLEIKVITEVQDE